MTSGCTIFVTNENCSSAPGQLTMPVSILSGEIETSQNEAYGHARGTSRQEGPTRSGEHLISVPEYMEEQAFSLLERVVIVPHTGAYCHSSGASGQTGIEENCSSISSNYEKMTSSASLQRNDTEIETSQNEAYVQINSSSGQEDANQDKEKLPTSLHINLPQNNGHSYETSGQTADINHNSSSSEVVTPPASLQRKDIKTLENEAYNCFDASLDNELKPTETSCFQESTRHLH